MSWISRTSSLDDAPALVAGEASRPALPRWMRSLRAAVLAIGLVLCASAIAWQAGKALEGNAEFFDKLEVSLVVVALAALPILFVALQLGLLERVRHIRLKLFIACLVGQIGALVAAVVAARFSGAMPAIKPPNDGLFAVLLVYAASLSLALAFVLAGSMTAVLARIRAGAARIAEGDLATRIETGARDELAELAADLNLMASRLDAAARQERRMEQSRRELIAAVSHDLRTPLAAIRATIEAITDGVVSDEETVRRYLRTMHEGTKELSRLIDDLFELSRIDAGALHLEPEPAALGDLVSDTLERMRPQADARGVILSGFAEIDLPPVVLDTRQIGRVLTNLVGNALRHTSSHGRVEVSARRDGPSVRVDVVDTGEGIAAADLPHLFERFYRGDKSRSRESGGAGLGLAICKGIVEAHGGAIWAEPVQPHGARFSFTLPSGGAAGRPQAVGDRAPHGPRAGRRPPWVASAACHLGAPASRRSPRGFLGPPASCRPRHSGARGFGSPRSCPERDPQARWLGRRPRAGVDRSRRSIHNHGTLPHSRPTFSALPQVGYACTREDVTVQDGGRWDQ